MTTETLEIRQLARQFAASDLRPYVEQWDHDGAIPSAVLAQLDELGFFGMLLGEADDGMGFDLPTYVAALEELAWGEPGVALLVAAANANGVQADKLSKVGLITDERGMFVVPGAGAQLGERVTTLGFRTVPLQRAEGPAPESSAVSLLGIAAIALGIAQAALEYARGYADEREQFNTKLRDFEGIQYKLAEMVMRIEAARALLQKAAAEPSEATTAMAKVFASETAMWVTTQAVQIYGGYGYMRDYPVEKLMREAKATELLQGPNDLLRVTIARNLYE